MINYEATNEQLIAQLLVTDFNEIPTDKYEFIREALNNVDADLKKEYLWTLLDSLPSDYDSIRKSKYKRLFLDMFKYEMMLYLMEDFDDYDSDFVKYIKGELDVLNRKEWEFAYKLCTTESVEVHPKRKEEVINILSKFKPIAKSYVERMKRLHKDNEIVMEFIKELEEKIGSIKNIS